MFFLISFLFVFISSGAAYGSSEIPERRHYPVTPQINPCENFYEYACSAVKKSHTLREDRSFHVFAFDDAEERILEEKKSYLTWLADQTPPALSKRNLALRNNYLACMNPKAAAQEERQIVSQKVAEIHAIPNRKAFQAYLGEKIDKPEFSFLAFDVTPNHANPDWRDVYFVVTPLSFIDKSYYEQPDILRDLEKLAEEFFLTIGLRNPAARAKEVIAFEKELLQTVPSPAEIRKLENTRNAVTQAMLLEKYPEFHLERLFSRFPKRTEVQHILPEAFDFMQEALRDKPLKTLKALYLFHALPVYMDDAYPAYFQKMFDFNKRHLGGPKVRSLRHERCTRFVMRNFPKEIDAELLPLLFPKFPQEKIKEIVEKVRASIIQGLEKNKWLSETSRQEAILKMKRAQLSLVKPEAEKHWNFNPLLDYSDKTPYANYQKLALKRIDKVIEELHMPRDRLRWHDAPLSVNAYYHGSDNRFILTQGILQYPFFDPELPDYVNFGSIGVIAGHELGHAIDDQGAKYDSKGELRQWMSSNDLEAFQKRGRRFVDQFNAIGSNGELQLGENIADFVGLTFAYEAAFPNGEGSLDAKKGFFLQYARTYCVEIRPERRAFFNKVDPHAIGEPRVNEQVKHQSGFQEAYACQQEDALFLPQADRVTLW